MRSSKVNLRVAMNESQLGFRAQVTWWIGPWGGGHDACNTEQKNINGDRETRSIIGIGYKVPGRFVLPVKECGEPK